MSAISELPPSESLSSVTSLLSSRVQAMNPLLSKYQVITKERSEAEVGASARAVAFGVSYGEKKRTKLLQ